MIRFLFLILCWYCLDAASCTLLVASGKSTSDGRPLLFKIRDSSTSMNIDMKIIPGDGYTFMGQYAIKDDGTVTGPWGGFNEKGFAVMNAVSYNIQKTTSGALNDDVIRDGLKNCATIDDFEKLLDNMEKPMAVRANFGVIDAMGNAAFYEVGQYGWVKYDANNDEIAPDGIIVRSNFSMSGDLSNKEGEDRYIAASRFVEQNKIDGKINGRDVIQKLSRFLELQDGASLYDVMPISYKTPSKTRFVGYVPRVISTNAMLVQGVKDDEKPDLTTLWTMAGPPLSTVAIPLVISSEGIMPPKVMVDNDGSSWLFRKGFEMKKIMFPYSKDNGVDYIELSKIINAEGSGIVQKLESIEGTIFNKWESVIQYSRDNNIWSFSALNTYYDWLDSYLDEQYAMKLDDKTPTNMRDTMIPVVNTEIYDLSGRRATNYSGKRVFVKSGGKIRLCIR